MGEIIFTGIDSTDTVLEIKDGDVISMMFDNPEPIYIEATGEKGDRGEKGDDGESIVGPQGEQGLKGDTGPSGANAVTAVMSNEAYVFPASFDGTVTSYSGSGTAIRVYEGAEELSYDSTGSLKGTWKIDTLAQNIVCGDLADVGLYVLVGNHSNVSPYSDISSIIFTISGRNSEGVSFQITKKQTFTKAKMGLTGIQGNPGPTGPASTVPGPQGEIGPAGPFPAVYYGTNDPINPAGLPEGSLYFKHM